MIFGYTCLVILAQFFFQLHVFCENVYVDQNGEVPPAAFASAKVISFHFHCQLSKARACLFEIMRKAGGGMKKKLN